MAAMFVAELPGATTEQYDRINELVGISPDNMPDGLIQHACGITDDGVVIVDVWESEEAFRTFMERVGPTLKEQGVPAFEPRVMPVHNMLNGAGTEPNAMMMVEVRELGPDAYDAMTSQMDAHARDGREHPAVSHTAAVTDAGGVFVVDLWESAEAFGRFAEDEIAPAGERVGLGRIEPRIVPVHNVLRRVTQTAS